MILKKLYPELSIYNKNNIMVKLRLDTDGILEYQQNRSPYLMIDVAEEIVPGKSAKGYKFLNSDEWFFKVHWVNDPNMPGMLQIEALIQMAALIILTLPGNKGKVVYVTAANNIRFSKKIVPGDTLRIETNLITWKRGIGKCYGCGKVDNKSACSADFNIILPDEISKFSVRK